MWFSGPVLDPKGMISNRIRLLGTLAASFLIGSMASAAPQIHARTRLQHCDSGTCLLVTGRRLDAAASVTVAGHDVSVEGMRNWQVALPLETVRAWSPSSARTITVNVGGELGGWAVVPLPIGLLGGSVELAFLEVRGH
jgi:hypothetical protein